MTPAFADSAAPSRCLHIVPADRLDSFLETLPEPARQWLRSTRFEGGLGDLRLLPAADGQVDSAVAGFGTPKTRRRTRFGLARAVAGLPGGTWHIDGPLGIAEKTEIALGWLLSQYRFDQYRPDAKRPETALLKCPEGCDPALLTAMAEGEYLTRDLINTPASDMGPAELEAAFLELADRFVADASVIGGDALLDRNFPLIHAVGRASPRYPRLLDMRWGERGPLVTLVGKGVCFDTGGLNIKPSSGMSLMKKDMGGAATVLGLALMVMRLNLPIRLRVLIPAVENVISGNAMKPKDIITSRKGLTVEVNDTDAEGRLVLADALAYACEEETELVISMATLTGAARVAVGPDIAPFYTDDPMAAAALETAAQAGFDPVWRMPLHDPYESVIEPGVADLDNAPGFGFAGSITAALFLRRFVDKPRYVHFDIYAHTPTDAPARPKGAVGQGARALLLGLPAMLGL